MDSLVEFRQLIAAEWEYHLRFDPIFATLTGEERFNDQLPHVTPAAWAAHLQAQKEFLARLGAIPSSSLPQAERLNYAIFKRSLEDAIREDELGGYYLPLSKAGGFHLEFPELFQFVPLNTVQDYENYIERLRAFQRLVAEYIELMRAGLALGYRPARPVLEGIDAGIRAQIVERPEASPLFQPFERFPATFELKDQERLRRAGSTAILESVSTGFKNLLRFILEEYILGAAETIGAAGLPNGREFYAHRVRMYTTTGLTPVEVHQTGLDEVGRIRGEMLALIEKTGFQGRFKEFIEFLRSDPRFYAKTGEELMAYTALVLKRMDGELPRLFKTLPRMPYGIRAIPEHSAPGNTTAYYFPLAGDGSRAGTYYVNLYDLPSRPLYEIEALSLHEAVPGHHLQIALQQELGELPHFRRFGGFTAYVEGWALYAERLGLEVGFYQDPYSNFGRLSYEMWRACRLVVDTGIHAFGWSRQQAIDFMAENTASTLLNIANEVDRYIAWPGQALAYKIGELKIRQLRTRAEATLGAKFDLRQFHEIVLGSGAVPLDVLELLVGEYLQAAGQE